MKNTILFVLICTVVLYAVIPQNVSAFPINAPEKSTQPTPKQRQNCMALAKVAAQASEFFAAGQDLAAFNDVVDDTKFLYPEDRQTFKYVGDYVYHHNLPPLSAARTMFGICMELK